MEKLTNSNEYKLFMKIKGTNPTAWNWQQYERALGIHPEYYEEFKEEFVGKGIGTQKMFDLGREIETIDK